ncbi:MAG: DNA cytosine methyltransferase [Isosphaeraceae bacterium]
MSATTRTTEPAKRNGELANMGKPAEGSHASSSGSRFKVGCLFAAIGGFCKAFELAGAAVAWANEKDRFARETFTANFPHIRFIHKSVEALSVVGDRLEPVDILTAGFPCQPFSVAGEKQGFRDERGHLFMDIIRIIKEFGRRKPKIILLENVRHFRTHDQGRTFKRVQTEIQKAGYWFGEKDARILNTALFTNIPQNRDRVFMVAMSCGHFASNTFQFPEPSPPDLRRPVWDFLDVRRKQKPCFYFTEDSQYHMPFRKALEGNDPKAVYQLRRNYVRKNMSGLCFTLMANMGEGGHNQPVIKDRWGIRKLTPRECARLQGYEDDWFEIPETLSHSQIYKQIGNSITIPLVLKLAESCIRELQRANSVKQSPNRGKQKGLTNA